MGMRLSEQRKVKRAMAEAFSYTADFSNIENWDPGVARSTKLGDGVVGLGTRFDLDVKFGSRQIPMVYEITAYEPPHRVVLVGRGETLDATDEIRFSQENGFTVIAYRADLTFRNALRFVIPFLGPVMRKVGKRALDGLAAALDTTAPDE